MKNEGQANMHETLLKGGGHYPHFEVGDSQRSKVALSKLEADVYLGWALKPHRFDLKTHVIPTMFMDLANSVELPYVAYTVLDAGDAKLSKTDMFPTLGELTE